MVKKFLLTLTALFSVLSGFAEIKDGYYRVTNANSGYYAWMIDNTGSINTSNLTADMHSLQLWPKDTRNPLCDPQSVIYVKGQGSDRYDLVAQGTSLHQMIGYYATITGTSTYQVKAVVKGSDVFLFEESRDNNYGFRGFVTDGDKRDKVWKALPISATSADNYFGIKPTMTSNGKHYAPFYASFPFEFASTGMKAYYISRIEDGVAILKEITSDVKPASTPMLIECSSTDMANNKLELLYNTGTAISDNKLTGNYFCTDFGGSKSADARITFDASTMRVWNVNADGKLVLSTATDNLHTSVKPKETDKYLQANSSYLKVAAGTAAELKVMTEEEFNNRDIAVKTITVTAASTSLFVGDITTVTATVQPTNATNKLYTWSSSNTGVATVDANGNVTATGKGTATITATAQDGSGVKGSVTITVQKHSYTVTFKGEDGTTLSSQTLEEGSAVTAPTAPAKEGYTFAGWTPTLSTTVTGNASYTATYDVNSYRLTYVADGKAYCEETYKYGETIKYNGSFPDKYGYHFTGYSSIPETMPAHDVTVEAYYDANVWDITYMVDGVKYESYPCAYGATITTIAAPTKEGYTFSGWQNVPTTMPNENITINGSFAVNTYYVIYMVDGAAYKTVAVTYGSAITAEANPTKEGYTFSGWSEMPATMPANDITVNGSFSVNSYTVTYMLEGVEYAKETYAYGAAVTAIKNPEAKTGYTFSGWQNVPETMPAHDVTVNGSYDINKYTLTYMVDGTVFTTQEYAYGDTIVAAAYTEKEGYTWSWNSIPETMPAQDYTIFGGSNTRNTYTVTYYVDGELYKTQSVGYDFSITLEAAPKKEGYTFSGWQGVPSTGKMPAHDIDITGTFTINSYDLVYKVDNATYYTEKVTYGTAITTIAEPTREGYTFSGWKNVPETMPASNWTITGSFKATVYAVNYYVDGEKYKTDSIAYGSLVIPASKPSKDGYTFYGWYTLQTIMPAHDLDIYGKFIAKGTSTAAYALTENKTIDEVISGANTITVTIPTATVIALAPEAEAYVISGNTIAEDASNICGYATKENISVEGNNVTVKFGLYELPATNAREAAATTKSYNVFFKAGDLIVDGTATSKATVVTLEVSADGIASVTIEDAENARFYSIDGKPMAAPAKGMNIIKMADGRTRKIMVK